MTPRSFSEEEASIVFSFTRSYFHVDVGTPGDLVGFLKSILPLKPVAELYISIGYNKHGKTERYRTLYRHLNNSNDKFEIAVVPCRSGMVMTVFTLPPYDMVFKIIQRYPLCLSQDLDTRPGEGSLQAGLQTRPLWGAWSMRRSSRG